MSSYLNVRIAGAVPHGLADELTDELGVYPHIESVTRHGVDPQAAEVVVSTAAAAFFGSMVQQFGAKAANQLSQGFWRLTKLAQRIVGRDSESTVIFIEEATGVRCVLTTEAVADPTAMQALLEMNYGAYHSGTTLRWHPQTSQWMASPPSR